MFPGAQPGCVVAVCMFSLTCWVNSASAQAAPEKAPTSELEGFWSGSWGGGMRGETVFQPVLAELLVEGDRVEMLGFRSAGRLSGTLRVDPAAKQVRITPTPPPGERSAAQSLIFSYKLQGQELTLRDRDDVPVTLHRQPLAKRPAANVPLELVATEGLDDAGNLLVTRFTVLRGGPTNAVYHQPAPATLNTRDAVVLLVLESSLKRLTVEEARPLIRKSLPVAVAYRANPASALGMLPALLQNRGEASPEGEAASQTLLHTLRPGTLVFVLPAEERLPKP